MSEPRSFTDEQKQYLAGFMLGADVARTVRGLPVLSNSGSPASEVIQVGGHSGGQSPDSTEDLAQWARSRTQSEGGKLCGEEEAKRGKNGLDLWDEIQQRADDGEFPKGTDVFLTKFHGLFYVAPAQDSYMCRLRIPGGEILADQLLGLAELSIHRAGGFIDITTRANLQLREIPACAAMDVLNGVRDLGIVNLGSGADNIRNVTASPLSGIDASELIETIPIARRMHHYIMNHRELYGLPRKFNIAFDGGGRCSALDDTNDIGFHAVTVSSEHGSAEIAPGVYFRLTLGGITGHRDFARDTGVLVRPQDVTSVASAIVRVFIKYGDRTDRKKARLKYLLDSWGFERFLSETEAQWGRAFLRADGITIQSPDNEDRMAHVGPHPQKQSGLNYLGVVFPAGRMSAEQASGLAEISRRYGSGRMRLTVWQNLLICDIPDDQLPAAQHAVCQLGLDYRASSFQAGLVACTGNAGCKFAASNTKAHGLEIAAYLQERLELNTPINIHLTGCHHSCAQHYIGDIGLLGTKVEVNDEMVEGYHIHVGGGWGERQNIARLIFQSVPISDVAPTIEGLIRGYLEGRENEDEPFSEFASRLSDAQLQTMGCFAQTAC